MHTRRRFLKNALFGAAGLASLSGGMLAGLSLAGNKRRRHLINIVAYGGWDSYWWHNAMPSQRLRDFQAGGSPFSSKIQLSESLHGTSALSSESAKPIKFSMRFNESSNAFYHPNYPGRHLMGLGMKNVFTPSEVAQLLIWKGLAQEGQHVVGNTVIQQGSGSDYALSFSAVVARGLESEDYLRPLHYAMIVDKPMDLFTPANMNSGSAIPICIGTWDQFKDLTRKDPNDLVDQGLRGALGEAVQSLTGQILRSKALLRSTQDAASAFAAGFAGSTQVAGSEMAKSIEFRYLYKRYILAMAQKVLALYDFTDPNPKLSVLQLMNTIYKEPSAYWGLKASLGAVISPSYGAGKIGPLPDMSAWRALKLALLADPGNASLKAQLAATEAALAPKLDDATTVNSGGSLAFTSLLRQWAYPYAMADFLVRNDLSAVVDIPSPIGDFHGANLAGLVQATATFSAYRELMNSLREVAFPEGDTLLDKTLIVMHSEMDREPFLLQADVNGNYDGAGTNHGYSTSLVMAGYGIRRGAVIGDLHAGPAQGDAYGDPIEDFAQPLPIDSATGEPKPLSDGGRVQSTKCILPTICAIFGIKVPMDQISEYSAVPAALKG